MIRDDLRDLAKVARTPGISGRWNELRNLVKTNHEELWDAMRTSRHFVEDMREDWQDNGTDALVRHSKHLIGGLAPHSHKKTSNILWLDLGDCRNLVRYEKSETFQDQGLGLLRTIMHNDGVLTDILSTRNVDAMEDLGMSRPLLIFSERRLRFES
ncbi:MAG: hypothetical protein GY937_06955 [bacterium]|nr:hypothetical protein [bacterium]